MVGDRPFTDIVYGNRNGFLTISTAPLSLAEEPFTVIKQGFKGFHQFTVFTSGRDAFTVVSRRSRGVHGGFHGGVHVFHGGGSRHSVYGGI
ncbi:hypothetical protein HanXRQr2_Chr12g0537481 [Helianthus annuus]|uniref:Uncharacterized protein n=1 Tax=Helianthus annuus TaxID=4232 RepID=A0A9K3MVQ1_HELAN|nr:hypothetical protein HanXRQr2_Chr12g0537481 [Helianthus annuus]KAJ0489104.1 hypothetical protein HanHA300_Chr12g0440191 [Helianthus annuus]KAJ0504982.1 hypothetical protein HanHA89_Chr12g0465301 [Helianthus annuus]